MGIEKLHKFHAYKPGSQVWMTPKKIQSDWSKQLDWYINFQIMRANNHNFTETPQEILQTLKENQIDLDFKFYTSKDLIMISTFDYLPTECLLVYNFQDFESFLGKVLDICNKLKLESIRIFLPKNISATEFYKKWPAGHTTQLSLVEDY